MTEQQFPAMIGFRHVIEDALQVIDAGDISPERREFVLQSILDFVREATRGFDIVRSNSFLVGTDDRSAFDAFSLVDSCLGENSGSIDRVELENIQKVMQQLQGSAKVSEDLLGSTRSLLSELLSSLESQANVGIPAVPEELRFAH